LVILILVRRKTSSVAREKSIFQLSHSITFSHLISIILIVSVFNFYFKILWFYCFFFFLDQYHLSNIRELSSFRLLLMAPLIHSKPINTSTYGHICYGINNEMGSPLWKNVFFNNFFFLVILNAVMLYISTRFRVECCVSWHQ
jgi:hypothetical protein